MKLGNMSRSKLANHLSSGSFLMQIGPFLVKLEADLDTVTELIQRFYGDCNLEDSVGITDFHLRLAKPSWSPDGELLLFTQGPEPITGVDIWTMPVPRDRTIETALTPQPFLQTDADEFHPALSPDGRWISYVSDVSGQWEVYVAPYPGPGARGQISTEGGLEPQWHPDGASLYYLAPDTNMMRVDVETGETFEAGIPESFNGLVKEMRSLGLDVELDNSKAQRPTHGNMPTADAAEEPRRHCRA